MSELLRRPLAFIALVILLVLLPAAFFQYSLLPQNPEQYLTHPGKEVIDYFSRDPTGSVIELAYAEFGRDQLRKGVVPLWSPYQGLGHPFVADIPLSALFAPLNVLRFILPPSYWDVPLILNLILACWFVYLLSRTYGLDNRSAIVAALSVAAVGVMEIHIQVSSIALVVSWIPLVLYGIELQLGCGRSRFRWIPLVTGLYGVITGGHPTITLLALIFAAAYACVRLLQARPGAVPVFRISALSLLGVLITAAQWVPFVAYVGYRGNTFRDYSALRFHIKDAVTFFLPYVYGTLNSTVAETRPPVDVGDYWSLGWLAPVTLVFTVAGFRAARRAQALALLISSAPVLLWAFGIPPFSLASKLPFLNRVRGHYGPVMLAFVVPMLIGLGYQLLARRPRKLSGTVIAAGVILSLAAGGAWATLALGGVTPEQAATHVARRSLLTLVWVAVMTAELYVLHARFTLHEYRGRLFWFTLTGIALSAIGFFPWGSEQAIHVARWSTIAGFVLISAMTMLRLNSKLLPGAAVVVIIASGLAIQSTPNHLPRRHELMQRGDYLDYLKLHQQSEYRSYGLDGFLFPNFSASIGIASVNVITGMVTGETEQFFKSYLDVYQGPEQIMGLKRTPEPDGAPAEQFSKHKRFWDYIGVRYVVSSDSGLAETVIPSLAVSTTTSQTAAQPPPNSMPQLLSTPARKQIECPAPLVRTVCFFLGNYNKVNSGKLTVRAFDEQGHEVSQAHVDSATIRDLACTRFEFPENICSAGQKRTLEISHQKGDPASGVAVFLTPGGVPASQILLSRGLRLRPAFQDTAAGVNIWENLDAQPRAYIAPETASASNWRRAQELFASAEALHRTAFVDSQALPCPSNPAFPLGAEGAELTNFEISPNHVTVSLNALTSGTLVLVDTFVPGWTARVDGQLQPVFRVNGAFRGTCIGSTGRHEIIFDYVPREWRVGILLTLSGFAGLAWLIVSSTRNGSRANS